MPLKAVGEPLGSRWRKETTVLKKIHLVKSCVWLGWGGIKEKAVKRKEKGEIETGFLRLSHHHCIKGMEVK